MRWETERSFDVKLCQESSYQKLSKSDNWFSSYSQKWRECFLRHSVYTISGPLTPEIKRLMFNHPKSKVRSSAGHVILLPGEFHPLYFPPTGLKTPGGLTLGFAPNLYFAYVDVDARLLRLNKPVIQPRRLRYVSCGKLEVTFSHLHLLDTQLWCITMHILSPGRLLPRQDK